MKAGSGYDWVSGSPPTSRPPFYRRIVWSDPPSEASRKSLIALGRDLLSDFRDFLRPACGHSRCSTLVTTADNMAAAIIRSPNVDVRGVEVKRDRFGTGHRWRVGTAAHEVELDCDDHGPPDGEQVLCRASFAVAGRTLTYDIFMNTLTVGRANGSEAGKIATEEDSFVVTISGSALALRPTEKLSAE
jgi:hypothetical protein